LLVLFTAELRLTTNLCGSFLLGKNLSKTTAV
jgi:hypothetical protein